MNIAIHNMLAAYNCQTTRDYENALKEIIQEIALLGLWRAQFFERAAFYGGTALRILYQLPRFSEDLDFSLLNVDRDFDLSPFLNAIQTELSAFGFSVSVKEKEKKTHSAIDSAFIKAGTKEHLLRIESAVPRARHVQSNQNLIVKIEVDTDPPPDFQTEVKFQLLPTPYSVRAFELPHMFAGKLHAILQRQWKGRVKGRDYYDFLWYLGRGIKVNLKHLEARLRQTGGWTADAPLTAADLNRLLEEQFRKVNFESAQADVKPFIKDPSEVALWSADFFVQMLSRLKAA